MDDVPGPLLASGRAADIYDIGDGKVLRRYRTRPSGAVLDASLEARAMAHVRDRGYPVPQVHHVEGTDLVMDHIAGPTMLEALRASPWKVVWHARVLLGFSDDLLESQRRPGCSPSPPTRSIRRVCSTSTCIR